MGSKFTSSTVVFVAVFALVILIKFPAESPRNITFESKGEIFNALIDEVSELGRNLPAVELLPIWFSLYNYKAL